MDEDSERPLKTLELSINSAFWSNTGMVTLKCTRGCSKVRVFRGSDRTGLVDPLFLQWSLPHPDLPETFWIEGIERSDSAQDVTFVAEYNGPDGPCKDIINLTVVGIISATDWLVVHDPVFERDKCQSTSVPRCEQAELMTNEAKVLVNQPNASWPFTVWLVEVGIFTNTDIVEGFAVPGPVTVEFLFRTTEGSTTDGAKTDENGGIYVEGVLLPNGPTGGLFGPEYKFELRLNGETIDMEDVTIAPLLTALSYLPDILASPPETVDPYSSFHDIDISFDGGVEDGFGVGEFFGLLIKFDLDDDLAWAPEFLFYNDTVKNMADTDSASGAGIIGTDDNPYQLFLNPSTDQDVAKAAITNKKIKWEGFTDNAIVRDGGFAEPAARVFKEGSESELVRPFDMGDGVLQSHRGVAPRFVVKEGHYINEFKIRRKLDLTQWQFLQVPFEVKYVFDP